MTENFMRLAIWVTLAIAHVNIGFKLPYLAKPFGLGMLFEAECWEVDACTEDPGLGQDTDTANAVQFHLHVRITIGIAEVGEVRPPRSVLGISFHDHGVLIQSICQRQGSFGFLP